MSSSNSPFLTGAAFACDFSQLIPEYAATPCQVDSYSADNKQN